MASIAQALGFILGVGVATFAIGAGVAWCVQQVWGAFRDHRNDIARRARALRVRQLTHDIGWWSSQCHSDNTVQRQLAYDMTQLLWQQADQLKRAA